MDDLTALVILNNLPHLGPVRIRTALGRFGSPCHVLKASRTDVEQLPGFGPCVTDSLMGWASSPFWKEDLRLIEQGHIHLLPYWDLNYPTSLCDLAQPPLLLYIKGKLPQKNSPSVAIVGTRNLTVYGSEVALQFAEQLARFGVCIVSGLARGIDTQAHLGALKGDGDTIAVIGSGLGHLYPPENAGLASKISLSGTLVSEYPMNTPPARQNFPHRNRIVAALSQAVLLVEAPQKSGAMGTLQIASSLKRATFAIPGRLDIPSFAGNHHLIKTGQAKLVENPRDIVSMFDTLLGQIGNVQKRAPLSLPLNAEEERLFQTMPAQELNIDELAVLTALSPANLAALLMSLVLKKRVKQFPGKIYKKIND